METLTQEAFNLIWDKESNNLEVGSIGDQLIPYIGGDIISEHQQEIYLKDKGPSHTVELVIIHYPTHRITNRQLCDIFDEGNHCISQGSIIYEDDMAYITWSNKGHI